MNVDILNTIEEVMDDFTSDFIVRRWRGQEENNKEALLSPKYIMVEKEKETIILINLAGYSKEQINLQILPQKIIVTADNSDLKKMLGEDNKKVFGNFLLGKTKKEFIVGSKVDLEKTTATHKDGVLIIVLPRAEVSSARKISIL